MSNWKYILIAILVLALGSSLYYNKSQISQIAKLKTEQTLLLDQLKSSQDLLDKKSQSCEINDRSTVELEQEKKEIQAKSDDIDKELLKLKDNVNKPVVLSTNKEVDKEVVNEKVYLPDDGLLSNELRRLLNKAYCSVESTDSSCNNSGRPSN